MKRQAPKYTIIGNGRLARHLCHYFDLLAIDYSQWHRSLSEDHLLSILSTSSHIIVAITDQEIEPFITQLSLQDQYVIHCSGALTTDLAYGAHPLQTFSHKLYTLEEYRQIPFIIEAEGPSFETLLPGLPNPHYTLHKNQKAYYHALCVMANNFTTLLWQKVFREFEQTLNIDHAALLPILERTTKNIATDITTALTGPIARGDTATIEKNLNSLKEDAFYDIYKAFVKSTKTTERA